MIPPFVSLGWLTEHRRKVVLTDVRWYLDGRSGRESYEAGHIPGAVYLELKEALADPPSDTGGRHPLPAPERFAAGLGQAGIRATDTVIAYDDAGGPIAARLVWMLRALGQPAALLDGGLGAWDGPLETGPSPERAATALAPRAWPAELVATIEEVAETEAILIDAREPNRYSGELEPVDPRPGHIPGAHNLPARRNLLPDGRIKAPDELREHFARAGIDGRREVISYCGSGVTACHNLLALEWAELPPGRLYPGSWSQWSRDPERPAATGPHPIGGELTAEG